MGLDKIKAMSKNVLVKEGVINWEVVLAMETIDPKGKYHHWELGTTHVNGETNYDDTGCAYKTLMDAIEQIPLFLRIHQHDRDWANIFLDLWVGEDEMHDPEDTILIFKFREETNERTKITGQKT